MANPQSALQSRLKLWGAVAIAILLAVWLGVPTFNKWRADGLVDELCAKDGGIKVYETVTLPAEMFNKWGQFEIPDEKAAKETDEYFRTWEITNIVGKRETSEFNELIVYRHHFKFHRKRDQKLLGELISYARRGGDPIGPWHPSSYACPNKVGDIQAVTKIFIKQPS